MDTISAIVIGVMLPLFLSSIAMVLGVALLFHLSHRRLMLHVSSEFSKLRQDIRSETFDESPAKSKIAASGRIAALRRLLWGLVELVLAGPFRLLSWCLPKKPGSIVMIKRLAHNFDGNLKYYYDHLTQVAPGDYEPCVLVTDRDFHGFLQDQGIRSVYYPSAAAFWALLRAQIIATESNVNSVRLWGSLAAGAVKYQLWHGNGFKNVGLINPRAQIGNKGVIGNTIDRYVGLYPKYDIVVFCSQHQEKARAAAFDYRHSLINGQPRNDILFARDSILDEIGSDAVALARMREAHARGMKVVLYSPTWRPKNEVQPLDAIRLDAIAQMAERENFLFVYKLHAKDKFKPGKGSALESPNVVEYDKRADIYPAMGFADCMITDYSSIYLDYIILDRPIIFFPYDLENYIAVRGFAHDYDDVTPGEICRDQSALEMAIRKVVEGAEDAWTAERKQVMDLFYDYVDGQSSERLLAHMRGYMQHADGAPRRFPGWLSKPPAPQEAPLPTSPAQPV